MSKSWRLLSPQTLPLSCVISSPAFILESPFPLAASMQVSMCIVCIVGFVYLHFICSSISFRCRLLYLSCVVRHTVHAGCNSGFVGCCLILLFLLMSDCLRCATISIWTDVGLLAMPHSSVTDLPGSVVLRRCFLRLSYVSGCCLIDNCRQRF